MAGAAVLTVADTIARSFLLAVEKRGDKPAIREKKFGIWQPTSWRQWLQISSDIAFALHATGFKPGDVASILANAVPEWVFADMGILCAGGVSSGIYPTDSAAQVEYQPGPVFVVALVGAPAGRDRAGDRLLNQDDLFEASEAPGPRCRVVLRQLEQRRRRDHRRARFEPGHIAHVGEQ